MLKCGAFVVIGGIRCGHGTRPQQLGLGRQAAAAPARESDGFGTRHTCRPGADLRQWQPAEEPADFVVTVGLWGAAPAVGEQFSRLCGVPARCGAAAPCEVAVVPEVAAAVATVGDECGEFGLGDGAGVEFEGGDVDLGGVELDVPGEGDVVPVGAEPVPSWRAQTGAASGRPANSGGWTRSAVGSACSR